MADDIRIEPMTEAHIESFHRALDTVARERKYLTLLEAPPLEETRKFALSSIGRGNVHLVALDGGEVIGWCDIRRHFFPSRGHCARSAWASFPPIAGEGLGSG